MIYKLHYAKLGLTGDIPCYEFDEIEHIIDFIEDLQPANSLGFAKDKVYLITDGDEIIVTQCYALLMDLFLYEIFALYEENDLNNVFLYENESFEDAYTLALLLKQNNKNCFSRNRFDIIPN